MIYLTTSRCYFVQRKYSEGKWLSPTWSFVEDMTLITLSYKHGHQKTFINEDIHYNHNPKELKKFWVQIEYHTTWNILCECNWFEINILGFSGPGLFLPDILVSLDIDLVEHGVFCVAGNISLHLHGNVSWQHRQ